MSLQDLKRFMFIGLNLNLLNLKRSDELLKKIETIVAKLISDGKGLDVLNELADYSKLYLDQFNLIKNEYTVSSIGSTIDCIALILAICSKYSKDEKFSNKVYQSLNQLSDTPVHLFAFIYYRGYLSQSKADEKDESVAATTTAGNYEKKSFNIKIGRGLKKSLTRWYSDKNEFELLRTITQYKHSYEWSNKDLFKLIHIKPKNQGADLIIKYVMFGYEKVKNENLTDEANKKLMELISDLEKLKHIKNGDEAAVLVKKHKLNYDHLPSLVRKFDQIWPIILEQLNLKEFCQNLNILFKKNLFQNDTPTERYVIERLLNKDNQNVKNLNPMYTCLATQIYEQLTSLNLIKMFSKSSLTNSNQSTQNQQQQQQQQHRQHQQTQNVHDRVKDSLWSCFQASVQNHKSANSLWALNQKIMIIVDVNTQMRNDHTDGIHCLNPIDTSACIMTALYYMSLEKENVDIYVATDKLTKLELKNENIQNGPDLNSIEMMFQGFASIEKNPNEKAFELASQNKKKYDVFLFLVASDSNEQLLVKEMENYRKNENLPNSKFVMINLTGKRMDESADDSDKSILDGKGPDLILNGWNFDSFFVLNCFLKNKF